MPLKCSLKLPVEKKAYVEIYNQYISILGLILLSAFLLCFLVQSIYYLFIYRKIGAWKPKPTAHSQEPVSIVICARDEEEKLEKNLPLVLSQEYPNYEVVVVNDCSQDDTGLVLERLQKQYPHLRTTTIKEDEKFSHGKKLALTIGIKSAQNEWLLLTDADCVPDSQQWLASMQRNFGPKNEIVLGYSGFNASKGLLNKLIRFDAFQIALNYLGLAMSHMPYMGVGRNLAYTRSLFFKNKGFASHAQILSGDDDLFINEVATAKNTIVEISAESITRSEAKKTFQSWHRQKRRHMATGYKYSTGQKFVLALEPLTRSFFYLLLVALLIMQVIWPAIIFIFLLRLIYQLIIFKKALDRLNEKKLLLLSLLFDFVLPYVLFAILIINRFSSRKNTWR